MLSQLFGACCGILLLVRKQQTLDLPRGLSWPAGCCSLRLPVEAAAAPVP